MYYALVVLTLLLATASSINDDEIVSLTSDNFQDMTRDKTVMLKFFAPWCDHCKELAPAWTKLANEWQDHEQGLVAQVDCTTEKSICKDLNILGLPTILYGDPSHGGIFLKRYDSTDKSYEALSAFANETLVHKICTPGNIEACKDEKTRETYKKFWKMSVEEIEAEIRSQEASIAQSEDDLKAQFQQMQKQYDELATNHEIFVARTKHDIKIIKGIMNDKLKQ